MTPFLFLLAQQAANPVVAPTEPVSTGTLVGGAVLAVVGWFLRDRLKALFGGSSSTPAVPLPDTVPQTDRPILNWMAEILLAQYGKDPKIAKAIKEEVEAIAAILDAANIPSPLKEVKS